MTAASRSIGESESSDQSRYALDFVGFELGAFCREWMSGQSDAEPIDFLWTHWFDEVII